MFVCVHEAQGFSVKSSCMTRIIFSTLTFGFLQRLLNLSGKGVLVECFRMKWFSNLQAQMHAGT